ncbi:MAG: CoA-binding protein [Candidatus Helarchaeota archaeon]|nr:CoA-binding protein [Candidatus Helarchaeota archaeon]
MSDMNDLFYPKNVAIIGVSIHPIKGGGFVTALNRSKFPKTVYYVNPNRSEVYGRKVIPTILDVPEIVDLAIIAVPARKCPEILKQCSGKVKYAVIFSSGFSEVGNKELEEETVKIAKEGNIRLIGPNCLGVHCNKSRLAFMPGQDVGNLGNVGFISQSGGHAGTFTLLANGKGIKFNKTVSIGNQCDLAIQDFIEYFGNDDEIKVIGVYIEDVKRDNFYKKVKGVTKKKPVIIWKGGVTKDGKRAAFSHTGALAMDNDLLAPIMKQTGVIMTDSIDELGDTIYSTLLLKNKLPKGKNIGIIVGGGGSSVEITDACAKEGLNLPQLSSETKSKIAKIIPDVNTSVKNPVDMGGSGFFPDIFRRILKFVSVDPKIDALITYQMPERFYWFNERIRASGLSNFDYGTEIAKAYKRIRKHILKPLICIIPRIIETSLEIENIRIQLIKNLNDLKIPTFSSITRGAKVYYRLNEYYNYLQRQK